ncbi:MAG: aminotransferase class I/II-fold pyridoxal phosphate-dependent enzyme [Thermodesulfobacteriota bacterium]|nr:MAG: aminotransferase class I/II-fold pyridoxal phosphate-dependent enzyme [Thermodesulfobacteriota bacterium]
MAIFDKLHPISSALQDLQNCGVDSVNVVIERFTAPFEAVINGRRTVLAGTNNYLGLTFDQECIRAACEALQQEGTGTTGSRMANGNYAAHIALERELAEFFGRKGAIVFSTGYVAILGMITALAGPGDIILIDSDCHASIYDGCRLAGAQFMIFKHNNIGDLEKRLRRLGKQTENTLIVVEGIYSMLGDRAILADIAAVKKNYGACILVDEAHSLGVLGKQGRGLAEEAGVEDDVDFIVGTFSKSLGTIGGYCVSNHSQLELLRFASRPYIFTASPSPSIIASTREALKIIRARPELRSRLWENARTLYQRLKDMDFVLGPAPSPIIPVRLKDIVKAVAFWNRLLEHGVYVNMVLPPATTDGNPLLRCSVSAGHTPEQVEQICEAFASLRDVSGPHLMS